jgi:hypothetical protein
MAEGQKAGIADENIKSDDNRHSEQHFGETELQMPKTAQHTDGHKQGHAGGENYRGTMPNEDPDCSVHARRRS